jgi:hypothetical protein
MSSKPQNGQQHHNAPLLTLLAILRMVIASAAEAGIGTLFLNAKEGVSIWNNLHEMGHPQPAMPLQTDNTTAHERIRGTCKQQRIKAIYLRFYWVCNCAQQGQFDIGWRLLAQNLGVYFTKHHTPAHHKGIQKMYIKSNNSPQYIPAAHKKSPQGCVDIAISTGTPASYHTNSAMADKPRTSTKWLCLARIIFRALHSTCPHKFS